MYPQDRRSDPRPRLRPGPNVNSARIVADSPKDESGLPADFEAAWAGWSAAVRKVNERADG
jgi:hypothetical protein